MKDVLSLFQNLFRKGRQVCLILIILAISGCLQPEKVNESPAAIPQSIHTPTPPTPTPTSTPTPLPRPTPTPVPGITATPWVLPFRITTDKTHYLPGESIEIRMSLENNRGETITVPSFPPETVVIRGITGEKIRTFPPGEKIQLKPGETVSYTLKWDQRDENGREVSPGRYYVGVDVVRVEVEDRYLTGFGGTHMEIIIGYPQGALNRTLELNESKTSNGITVVLQKIEFSPSDVKFYLKTDIPLYSGEPVPIPTPLPTPPDVLTSYSASLKVDGEERPVKDWAFRPDDKWTIIFIADPVPSDAKRLSFVVRNAGTWEFNVSLK